MLLKKDIFERINQNANGQINGLIMSSFHIHVYHTVISQDCPNMNITD